ncbi:MAG: ATP-binding protein [Erysipelotrichaceae bacterium]|nr:ATP-binding protein [Erysipelotrichaceae bacterium]
MAALKNKSMKKMWYSISSKAFVFLLIIALFLIFMFQNKSRIERLNESYVQESSIQKAQQIDSVFKETLENMKRLSYWFSKSLTTNEVQPEQLAELENKTDFDYVRFVDVNGVNIASDGSSNDALDREYYIEGMKGNSGISTIETSRITGETLVNFYTPLMLNDQIIGVLRGVYLANQRMHELLKTSFFGVQASSFLCTNEGNVISLNHKEFETFEEKKYLNDFLTSDVSIDENNANIIKKMIQGRKSGSFFYKEKGKRAIGYVTHIECVDWLLIETFPTEVTERMYNESIRAGVFLEISLIVLFFAYLVYLINKNRIEKNRLLEENKEMDYVIHGTPKLFDSFVMIDLENNSYRYLLNTTPLNAIASNGSYNDFLDNEQKKLDEDERKRFRNFTSIENIKLGLKENENGIKDEYKYCKDDTNEGYFSINVVCLEKKDDIPSKALIGIQDITKSKLAEIDYQNTLKKAMEDANKASEAKSTFLFNMSHDIRTPMNAIIGFADLIEKNAYNGDEVKNYIGKVKKSSKVLLKIINDVLDLAHIESGKAQLVLAPHNLYDDFYDIKDMFVEEMERAGLDFHFTININNNVALYDDLSLSRICINLLGNAIKFTKKGGHVDMDLSETKQSEDGISIYTIKVSDSGIGISKEFMDHIFDAFERDHSNNVNKTEGSGLGLSIVNKLVKMMNGTISVESIMNKGTTFTINLPLKVIKSDINNNKAKENKYDFSAKRFLLVEDNDLNREIAINILSDTNAIIDIAQNGKIAVDKVKESSNNPYDVILMDIQMPIMNGYEATRIIRLLKDQKLANLPIIAMTANAFEEDKKLSYEAGMNYFVAKPIDVEELYSTINKALNK